jgi:pimeloyl-ACP methyl ester carboxylesterase
MAPGISFNLCWNRSERISVPTWFVIRGPVLTTTVRVSSSFARSCPTLDLTCCWANRFQDLWPFHWPRRLCSSFAGNPRPRLRFIRPLLPFLPFHGSGASLRLSRFLVLGRWITPAIRELHQKILSSVPAKTIRSRLEAVADCDVRTALASVRLPIMCLVARHDRLIPRAAARLIQQQAPSTTLIEIDAPHCLLQCEPRSAAAQIRQFLQTLVAQPGCNLH